MDDCEYYRRVLVWLCEQPSHVDTVARLLRVEAMLQDKEPEEWITDLDDPDNPRANFLPERRDT